MAALALPDQSAAGGAQQVAQRAVELRSHLEHDPAKSRPVFGQDHAPTRFYAAVISASRNAVICRNRSLGSTPG
jgi:hypothetical protein